MEEINIVTYVKLSLPSVKSEKLIKINVTG